MVDGLLQRLSDAPVAASTFAHRVDHLFYAMLAASAVVVLLLGILVVTFCVRYRHNRDVPRGARLPRKLEYVWTLVPLGIFLAFFFWGGSIYLSIQRVPDDALQIRAVAKQWMWKFYHGNGHREVNELHIPVDRPVQIVLSSEDVIHSFYVPRFRIKQDAVPGRYTDTWFVAERTGIYRLFCAEFCGTQHSQMRGIVHVMAADDYARWLESGGPRTGLAHAGEKLFHSMGCSGCHAPPSDIAAPRLYGLYGHPVALASGQVIIADEAYLRDSIMQPEKQVVAGFVPVMPSFANQIGEEELIKLIAYIKSLSDTEQSEESR